MRKLLRQTSEVARWIRDNGGAALTALVILVAIVLLEQVVAPTDVSVFAQLIAVAGLVTVSLALFAVGPPVMVAIASFALGPPEAKRSYERGDRIAGAHVDEARRKAGEKVTEQRGYHFARLYTGVDGRWSTSKLAVVIWTYAVLFGLATLWVAHVLGDSTGWDRQIGQPLQDTYLILLGGPFAAAVLAKLSTSSKASDGKLAKTEARGGEERSAVDGLSDVVSDDSGDTDLIDMQYFLFNLLALVVFLGEFCFAIEMGFPDIPDLLVGLTGASGLAYVGKKAAEGGEPKLASVKPQVARAGDEVVLAGSALIVDAPSAGVPPGWGPTVTIAKQDAEVVKTEQRQGTDRITVLVPETVEAGVGEVKLITALDTPAKGESEIEIGTGVEVQRVSPVTVAQGQTGITVTGSGFGVDDGHGEVVLDGKEMHVEDWSGTKIVVSVNEKTEPTATGKLIVKSSRGETSVPYRVVVRE